MLKLLLFAALVAVVAADTPANCSYPEVVGEWIFTVGKKYKDWSSFKSHSDCENYQAADKLRITLDFPDVAIDNLGNMGTWTLIYNQGFEITLNNRKYFAFSKYVDKVSSCGATMPSWTHDVLIRQWACFSGVRVSNGKDTQFMASHNKQNVVFKPKVEPMMKFSMSYEFLKRRPFKNNHRFINHINSIQSNWIAVPYDEFENKTLHEMFLMSGGPKSKYTKPHNMKPIANHFLRRQVNSLPESFDWRNVSGVNYVAPVRHQDTCGSCYSFASAALLESRIRIVTNNAKQPILSPQNVVDCSKYSQGCDGGFPYLIAGKYAEDFGMVEESCAPYQGVTNKCPHTADNCTRWYATNYRYVGGYYGACNAELMKLALHRHGPLAVGFEVLPDFQYYRGGIYTHTGLLDRFNPFEITNHAVLVVGYGVDSSTGMKYWSVKNSWGKNWGENGYFRIRRGTDEVGIESLAVTVDPVL